METRPDNNMNSSIEMRLAKKEDLEELRAIWKLCFGDEDLYLDLYFQRDWVDETAVLLSGDKIASMLTMIPVDLIAENDERYHASMLYAIATHPEHEKRGFAGKLIEFSNQYLLTKEIPFTLLVPAEEHLIEFYRRRGYNEFFFVREAALTRDEIEKLAGPEPFPCRVTPIEPLEYNNKRKELLKGHDYIDYLEKEISFQKQLNRMFDADIFAIEIEGTEGCGYAERISQKEVIVKELLIPDIYLASAVKQISELFPGEKYIVRTPPYTGESLGGKVRSFGMLRVNGAEGSLSNSTSYLGIAYD